FGCVDCPIFVVCDDAEVIDGSREQSLNVSLQRSDAELCADEAFGAWGACPYGLLAQVVGVVHGPYSKRYSVAPPRALTSPSIVALEADTFETVSTSTVGFAAGSMTKESTVPAMASATNTSPVFELTAMPRPLSRPSWPNCVTTEPLELICPMTPSLSA